MNIEKVYLCDIYKLEDMICEDINIRVNDGNNFNLDNIFRIKRKISFVKKALVYFSEWYGCFIDLKTNEKYGVGYGGSAIGDLFIDVNKEKVYASTIIGSDRKHMSKRKILKKYNDIEEGERRE